MRLRKNILYIIIILLAACSPEYTLQSYNNDVIGVQNEIDSTIINIIRPYKHKIVEQMDEVLTYTKSDLEKGKPQSTIGNFVTDLCLNYADAHLCVMNNGGLRTTINKGKKQHKVGIKLRDAIIEYCKNTDTIDVQLDNRITIIDDE